MIEIWKVPIATMLRPFGCLEYTPVWIVECACKQYLQWFASAIFLMFSINFEQYLSVAKQLGTQNVEQMFSLWTPLEFRA